MHEIYTHSKETPILSSRTEQSATTLRHIVITLYSFGIRGLEAMWKKCNINDLSVRSVGNGKGSLPSNASEKRVCEYCGSPLEGGHVDRQFCDNKCRAAAWRRRKTLERHGIVEHPLCLHGSFQSYAATYRSKIDVIITDPPYGREYLPLYQDLAIFALTTLQAGGWLLCLTGWGLDLRL